MTSNQGSKPLQKTDEPIRFKTITLDLTQARTSERFAEPGFDILVPHVLDSGTGNTDFEANFEIRFRNTVEDQAVRMSRSSEVRTQGFREFYITNTAQANKVCTLVLVTAPIGFRYRDNLSAGISTINTVNTIDEVTNILNLESVDNVDSVDTVDLVTRVGLNGPADFQDLGANGQAVFVNAQQFVNTVPSTTTTVLYTVPSGKKAYPMTASLVSTCDSGTANIRAVVQLRLNAQAILALGNTNLSSPVRGELVMNFPYVEENIFIAATQTVDLRNSRVASSPGGGHEVLATMLLWECDA